MRKLLAVGVATVTMFCLLTASAVRSFAQDVLWLDDIAPTGAIHLSDGSDAWNWTTNSRPTVLGELARQSNQPSGLQGQLFNYATTPLNVGVGDVLIAYVYVGPANPPTEAMLNWTSNG